MSPTEDNLKVLRDCLAIATSSGNYDYSPYMHGMANGMILCLAVLEDKEPEYLEAPRVWLCDKLYTTPTEATKS